MTPREQFQKETGESSLCYSTTIGSFNDAYVIWLEQQILLREQAVWDAARKMVPAISGPAGRKYNSIEDWKEKDQ
jgi:hypothetical protein